METNITSNRTVIVLAFLVLAGSSAGAYAQSGAGSWYVTGAIGRAHYDIDYAHQVRDAYADPQYSVESATLDRDHATSYRLGVGYYLNPYLAVELAYADLGEAKSHYQIVSGGVTYARNGKYRLDGFNAALLGRWPVMERFALLGKLGVMAARLKYSETGSQTFGSGPYSFTAPDDSMTRASFGLGAEYRFDANWSARLDWDRVRGIGRRFNLTESENGRFNAVDALSLGVIYSF